MTDYKPTPNPELVYHFHRDVAGVVRVKRGPDPLPPRPDIWSAIAETFDAGHCGPRAHALAIAMLADALDDLHAVEHCEAFVAGFLAPRKTNAWNCRRRDIMDWADNHKLNVDNDEP